MEPDALASSYLRRLEEDLRVYQSTIHCFKEQYLSAEERASILQNKLAFRPLKSKQTIEKLHEIRKKLLVEQQRMNEDLDRVLERHIRAKNDAKDIYSLEHKKELYIITLLRFIDAKLGL